MIHVNTEGILLGGIISDAILVSKIAKAEDVGHLGVIKIDRTKARHRAFHSHPLGPGVSGHGDRP